MAHIDKIDFKPKSVLSNRFEVVERLGGGWEGEVFRVLEIATGIERTAKVFYPQRNKNNRVAKFYAKKLHKLRHCHILIKYFTQEKLRYKGHELTYLISEYVEGETLDSFLKKQRGKKMNAFQALHLLHALAKGMQKVHDLKEYHGDLHAHNIIVQRYGLGFEVKLIDMFYWDAASGTNIREDVCDLIRVFYDAIGGKKYYAQQPKCIKDLCCGLKKSLILKKFRTAGQLRHYIERMEWEE